MALRFSYRISTEVLNEPSVQPERQRMDSHHRPEAPNTGEQRHDSEQSKQERVVSCLDLLTSF